MLIAHYCPFTTDHWPLTTVHFFSAPFTLIAQEFKTSSAKEALAKDKVEFKKAEAIMNNADTQYHKVLNKALAAAIKEVEAEEASTLIILKVKSNKK